MKTPLIFGAAWLMLPLTSFAAVTVQLSTADSPFNAGIANQGWYSPTVAGTTDDYSTGYFFGNDVYTHGFLTFDLSNITGPVTSARLWIRAGESMSPDSVETIDVHAVQTDAAVLNARTGAAKPIFDDLGSGPLLADGGFKVGQSGGGRVGIVFEPAGIAEINAKRGGFLSLGLQVASLRFTEVQDEFVFANSASLPNLLELTVVPEPSALGAAACGLFGLAGIRRPRRRAA
jgi:hypothetical protein